MRHISPVPHLAPPSPSKMAGRSGICIESAIVDALGYQQMQMLEATLKKTIVSALKTELTLGLTLTAIASQVRNAIERQRIRNSARLSYDTAVRRMHTVHRFAADDIHSQLALLRVALEQLGETF